MLLTNTNPSPTSYKQTDTQNRRIESKKMGKQEGKRKRRKRGVICSLLDSAMRILEKIDPGFYRALAIQPLGCLSIAQTVFKLTILLSHPSEC